MRRRSPVGAQTAPEDRVPPGGHVVSVDGSGVRSDLEACELWTTRPGRQPVDGARRSALGINPAVASRLDRLGRISSRRRRRNGPGSPSPSVVAEDDTGTPTTPARAGVPWQKVSAAVARGRLRPQRRSRSLGTDTGRPAVRNPATRRSRLRSSDVARPAYTSSPSRDQRRQPAESRSGTDEGDELFDCAHGGHRLRWPLTHPTFHPVVEKVLPADEMVSVVPHFRAATRRRWFGAAEGQMLVDLIGHHPTRAALSCREAADEVDLAGEHRRVVGCYKHHARAVTEGRAQGSFRRRTIPGSAAAPRRTPPASAIDAAYES